MKKYIFAISCGIFMNEVLVAINSSYEDILEYAKENKLRKSVIKGIEIETTQ